MKSLLALAAAIALSVVLYLGVCRVAERPLTLGDLKDQLAFKLAYARTLPSPKLVIFAGSNGRYSHRCAMLTEATGLPCVNLSLAYGLGLDYQFDRYGAVLQRGDIVYMPLEYEQYGVDEAGMHGGPQNALMVQSDSAYLHSLPLGRQARAYGYFDLPYLIDATAEMILARRGFHRRTGLDTLTAEGDEKDHTEAAAAPYRDFVKNAPDEVIDIPKSSYTLDVLRAFLQRESGQGVTVIGGLPTVPTTTTVSDATIARVRAIFEDAGQQFIWLPNRSQYPRDCFFDSLYHLNESCQIEHSRLVGRALADQLAHPQGAH